MCTVDYVTEGRGKRKRLEVCACSKRCVIFVMMYVGVKAIAGILLNS